MSRKIAQAKPNQSLNFQSEFAVPERRQNQRKSAPWKVQLAMQMKDLTDAPNGWLATELGMGSGVYVSKHIGITRKKVKGKA